MSINTRPNHVCLSSFKKTLVKLHCLSSKHNALNVLSFSWWCFRLKKSNMFLIEDNFVDLKCQDKRKHGLKLDIICNVLCVFSFVLALAITITQTDGQLNVVPAIRKAANPYANIIQIYSQFVDRNHHPHLYTRWAKNGCPYYMRTYGGGLVYMLL